jgi:ABC-type transport system substrate-binding protein
MEIGLRAEYVQGIDRAGQEERLRISPGLTWYLNDARSAYTRMQYNYDDGAESGESHGFWVQFGLNWGGAEVR